jgi:hypothetical protein
MDKGQGKVLQSLALLWEAIGLRDCNTLPFCIVRNSCMRNILTLITLMNR